MLTCYHRSLTLKRGLVYVEQRKDSSHPEAVAPEEQYFFSADNGDDWFYIEDSTSSEFRTNGDSSPLLITTESASGTELIRFKYRKTPDHRVVHPGRCNFAGLAEVGGPRKMDDDDHTHRLTVQLDL
jgi:hypothetical protein